MSNRTVSFSYTVGSARFNTDTEVDSDEWDEMEMSERMGVLEEAAMEDIESNLEVEEESIED